MIIKEGLFNNSFIYRAATSPGLSWSLQDLSIGLQSPGRGTSWTLKSPGFESNYHFYGKVFEYNAMSNDEFWLRWYYWHAHSFAHSYVMHYNVSYDSRWYLYNIREIKYLSRIFKKNLHKKFGYKSALGGPFNSEISRNHHTRRWQP